MASGAANKKQKYYENYLLNSLRERTTFLFSTIIDVNLVALLLHRCGN